jgi:radical SAM superfamily enzyme YgiQ (UPF0313 family)
MKPSVLLVNTTDAEDLLVYPIGLDYLVSALEAAGAAEVSGLDLALCASAEQEARLVEALSGAHYEVIGFNLRNLCDQTTKRIQYVPRLARLIETARRALDGRPAVIAVGGAGASLAPETILAEVGADVLISGDGEAGFFELLDDLSRGGASRRVIEARTDIREIEYRRGAFGSLEEYARRDADGNLQSRRGCSMACDYCSYPVIEGAAVRMRDPERVAEEFVQLERFGFKKIFIVDAIFNSPLRHAKEVLRAIEKRKTRTEWTGFFSPKFIDTELLELVKATNGGRPLKLTIESGSNAMLESLHKGFDKEDILRATRLCREVGVPFSFTVLFGGVGEDRQTVVESLALIQEAQPAYVSASIGVYVYPKTPLARRTLGRIWNNEEELMGKTVYPVDREMVRALVEEGLRGSPFPVYLHI